MPIFIINILDMSFGVHETGTGFGRNFNFFNSGGLGEVTGSVATGAALEGSIILSIIL